MSRGILGFVAGGELKASYNHDSSYPGGLGLAVLRFVRQLAKDGAVPAAIERVRQIRVVTDDTPVTPADVAALRHWTDRDVGGQTENGVPSWYQLLRRTQGDPDGILTAGYLEDSADFGRDSAWCEWGYVIDLDAQVLEIYKPREDADTRPAVGRWAGQEDDDGYPAISLLASYPFDRLPSENALLMLTGTPCPG